MRIRWRQFELPSRVVADPETASSNYAKFAVEPFERGFGHTVGNGLRRVLLSSIEGYAITHVQVDGVQHEFTAIEGVLEDVVDVVLNLKGVLLRLNSAGPVKLHLEADKKGPVTASHIQCPADAEILNPDHVLCTLTEDRELRMTLEARRGRGYHTAEENEALHEEKELGVIAIDSNFSPVLRVRYKCEDTRVGKITNYDKLQLEIWTDGSVTPDHALVEAAKIYRKHLNPFIHYLQPGGAVLAVEDQDVFGIEPVAGVTKEAPVAESDEPISVLELSVRARNCLDSENIRTIGHLMRHSETELLELRNFGQTSLKEVKAKLAERGMALRGSSVDEVLSGADGDSDLDDSDLDDSDLDDSDMDGDLGGGTDAGGPADD